MNPKFFKSPSAFHKWLDKLIEASAKGLRL